MNPDATSSCQFCAFRTTDQFLALSFNIRYSHHWRNAGIFLGFTVLNVSTVPVASLIHITHFFLPSDRRALRIHVYIPNQDLGLFQAMERVGKKERYVRAACIFLYPMAVSKHGYSNNCSINSVDSSGDAWVVLTVDLCSVP